MDSKVAGQITRLSSSWSKKTIHVKYEENLKISSYQIFHYHQENLFYSFSLYKHFIINIPTILLYNYLSSGLFYWCRFSPLQACPTLWRTSWARPRWRWRFPGASPAVSSGGSAHSTGPTPRWPRTTAWPHCCPPVKKRRSKFIKCSSFTFIQCIIILLRFTHCYILHDKKKETILRQNKFNISI